MIIGLGFPRSGTGYFAKHYQSLGLDVGHETVGKHGVVDWRLVPIYKREENDTLIHIVRNPLEVISSATFTISLNGVNKLMEEAHVPVNHLYIMMIQAWIEWNKMIESYKPDSRIRVEDLKSDNVPKNYNSRPHPMITIEHLKDVPKKLLSEFMEMSRRYGYDICSNPSKE